MDNSYALAAIIIATVIKKRRKRRVTHGRRWARDWLQRRDESMGTLSMLENELRFEDHDSYRNFIRMSENTFEILLSFVRSKITYTDTVMRQSISAEKRLAVTLRFLATGEMYQSLMYSTRIAKNTLSGIIPQVCAAIYESLKDKYLKTPATASHWKCVASEFSAKWNFPNCIGAMDGKHIEFRPARADGSIFRNYEGSDSIILLAVVDANYKFLMYDVGKSGRAGDAGVFRDSNFRKRVESGNELEFPPDQELPGYSDKMPYVIVADDAFPLKRWVMKPFKGRDLQYEERIFNYRLSRARRVCENAFGILANRFRIFLTKINLRVEKVKNITLACLALHNFILKESQATYMPPSSIDFENVESGEFTPGSWREDGGLQGLVHQCSNHSGREPVAIRNKLKEYFCSIGSVSWQHKAVQCHNY